MGSVHACPDLSNMHAEGKGPAGNSRWRPKLDAVNEAIALATALFFPIPAC